MDKKIYRVLIELIEAGKTAEHTILNYLMLKSIKGNNSIINKKTGVEIEPGEYQISLRKLSEKTHISFQTVRTAISYLNKIGVLNFSVKCREYVFSLATNTDNSLNCNVPQDFPTQQDEKSTQQNEKTNTDNSLNYNVPQDFPTQQNEKIDTPLINNNSYLLTDKKTAAAEPQIDFVSFEDLVEEFQKYYSYDDAYSSAINLCNKSKSKGKFKKVYLQERINSWVTNEKKTIQKTDEELSYFVNKIPVQTIKEIIIQNGINYPVSLVQQIATQSKARSEEEFKFQIDRIKEDFIQRGEVFYME